MVTKQRVSEQTDETLRPRMSEQPPGSETSPVLANDEMKPMPMAQPYAVRHNYPSA
jgi:hypothetical protein